MVDKLTPAQIKQFKEVFLLFDQEKNGVISRQELGNVMQLFGRNPTESEVNDAIQQSDYTQNGVIDFSDFLIIMTSNVTNKDIEEDLKEAFKMFDLDGSGYILASELRTVMERLGENLSNAEILEIIKLVDRKNIGKVSYADFRDFFFDKKK